MTEVCSNKDGRGEGRKEGGEATSSCSTDEPLLPAPVPWDSFPLSQILDPSASSVSRPPLVIYSAPHSGTLEGLMRHAWQKGAHVYSLRPPTVINSYNFPALNTTQISTVLSFPAS